MGFWPVVKKVVKDADIVLIVLDARMPGLSKNKELERLIEYHDKRYLYVFTKVDLVSVPALRALRDKYPVAAFVSGAKNLGMSKLKARVLMMAKEMKIERPLVGIVGYPNVGKSAIINALAKRARAKVSSVAGTTKGIQWVNAGSLRIMDSPGVVPLDDRESDLGVMGAKNPERLRNAEGVASSLLKRIVSKNPRALEKKYGISVEGKDGEELFLEIGRKLGFLLKGGVVDEHRTAMFILKSWQKGKLGI